MNYNEKQRSVVANCKRTLIEIRKTGKYDDIKKDLNFAITTIVKLHGTIIDLIQQNTELKKQVAFQKRIIRTLTQEEEEV